MDGMINNQKVIVRLAGDNKEYEGIVLNAKKKWVEISNFNKGRPFIADECNIVEWRDAG